jgi:Flp pilus assembly protein TadD
MTDAESVLPANEDAVTSAAASPPAPEAAANLNEPVKPRRRVSADYWIAGLIVLVIAAFAGRGVVGWLVSPDPSPSSGGTGPEASRVAVAHITLGMSFYNASDFARAEAEFRKAVQADPNSAVAYNDLGAVLNSQGRWDEALPPLRKAIELDPTMDLAKNNLAFSYSQKALANRRTSPTAAASAVEHINLGMGFYHASEFTKAEAEFRKAVQADPDSALAYNDLGAVLNSQRRWNEAIPALRKAIELNPAMDLAKNNLAFSIAQKAHGGDGRK